MVEAPTAEEADDGVRAARRGGARATASRSQSVRVNGPCWNRGSPTRGSRRSRHRQARASCAGSSATSGTAPCRSCSSRACASSSTAATTPPGISMLADGRDRLRARRRQPRRAARRAGDAAPAEDAAASPSPSARRRPASATRAGPRTAASTRTTPTRTSTRRPRPRRGQRHRRELHGAQAGALSPTGAVFTLRDRRRGRRPPDRRSTSTAGDDLVEAVRAAYAELARPLRVRRDVRRRARAAGRRAQGVPAGRRPRRGRAVPRLRDPRLPRATRATCS